MIVHDSWWSNGSARSTIIDYHAPFDQGLKVSYRGGGPQLSAMKSGVQGSKMIRTYPYWSPEEVSLIFSDEPPPPLTLSLSILFHSL